MSRWRRHAPGGIVYHVLNRAARRSQVFYGPDDYGLFISLLLDAARRLGASVEEETMDGGVAYSRVPGRVATSYRDGWLPQ
jgi:REP element-mobilizing transposase RayT